jgi:hypothetical protein
VLAALQAWDPVVGLVVGSLWAPTTLPGLSAEGLHALAREVAEERARTEWRQMGARSEHEALGIFVHDVHRRWGSVFWRSWLVGGRASSAAACPLTRHREAERRDPPPRPAARVRARPSGRGRGGAVAVGAPRRSACGRGARRGGRACERGAAAAGWQVALAAAKFGSKNNNNNKFARRWILDWTLVSYAPVVRARRQGPSVRVTPNRALLSPGGDNYERASPRDPLCAQPVS